MDIWNECPRDCLINIFSFVDLKDLASIRAVNKKWNILSYDKRVFSRNMRDILVTGSEDKTLKVWREKDPSSLNSWKEIKILKGHIGTVIFSYLQYFKFNFYIFRLDVVGFQEMENILFLVLRIKLF